MVDLLDYFHRTDPIWDVNSHQEFINIYIVKGKFHSNVPEEIVKEYEVVERLLCYSFYSYRLIDEAFSKVTRIFEGGVKLRLKELGIQDENKFESLNSRLKKLTEFTTPEIFKDWNQARKIRNIFAHPASGQLFGITVHRSFLQMVNVLNTLFLDQSFIHTNKLALEKLQNDTLQFKDGLFKLEIEDEANAYLVWSAIPYEISVKRDECKSFWVFRPVFNSFPQTTDEIKFNYPFFLGLKDIHYDQSSFIGVNLNNNKQVRLSLTDKIENINRLDIYNKMFSSSEAEVKKMYNFFLDTELSYEIVKFIYNEYWD